MSKNSCVFLDTKNGVTSLTLEVPGVSISMPGWGKMEWIRVGKAVELGAKQIQQKTIFCAGNCLRLDPK